MKRLFLILLLGLSLISCKKGYEGTKDYKEAYEAGKKILDDVVSGKGSEESYEIVLMMESVIILAGLSVLFRRRCYLSLYR